MTVTEQRYEGEYRYVNSRLITNRFTQEQLLKPYDNTSIKNLLSFLQFIYNVLFFFSEEIAFYNGNMREKQTIYTTFKKLVGNSLAVFPKR